MAKFNTDLATYQETLRDHVIERCRDAPKGLDEFSEFGGMSNEELTDYILKRCPEMWVNDVKRDGLLQLAWATDDVVSTVG